jgi:hypothetical protein
MKRLASGLGTVQDMEAQTAPPDRGILEYHWDAPLCLLYPDPESKGRLGRSS